MVDTNGLRAEMARNGLSMAEVAKKMEMPTVTMYSKMKSGYFTVNEAYELSEILNLTEPAKIFFAKELS